MCGIFGCFNSSTASEDTLDGLRRLEYRGYDSWGLAAVSLEGELHVHRKVGQINGSNPIPNSRVAIGHTRWATHGEVNVLNAHPHRSADGRFAVVHNGVIENAEALRDLFDENSFESSTDTEVFLRLVERELKRQTTAVSTETALLRASCRAFRQLEGRNALIIVDRQLPQLIALRNRSPLVVGLRGATTFLASDTLAFADKCDRAVFPADMQGVQCRQGGYSLFRIEDGARIQQESVALSQPDVQISKKGFPHFMIKEIVDQGQTGSEESPYQQQVRLLEEFVSSIHPEADIYLTGAGSAYYTAAQSAYFLRTRARRSALAIQAYEVDSYIPLLRSKDVLVAISQSGETADTVLAAEKALEAGIRLASLVNMPGATLSRMSDYAFFNKVGPELCVLSTKSACAQIAFGYLFAQTFLDQSALAVEQLDRMPKLIQSYLAPSLIGKVHGIAEKIQQAKSLFVLGKGSGFHLAQIAALNIKEASYVHAEGIAAGELKHGVIALIESGLPVVALIDSEQDRQSLLASIAEVKARGAFVIGVAARRETVFDAYLPLPQDTHFDLAQIVGILPGQLLAYHLAVLRGVDPDRPRNLAKSVTVL